MTAADPVSVWKTHRPELQRICRSILDDPDEADDVADGVLVDFLFAHLAEVKRVEAIGAYLRLMAARRALQKKRRSREVRRELEVAFDAAADDAAERALLVERLAECTGVLSSKARTVLRLRFAGDLTAERIGQLVGGSKQYIGQLLAKSCARLKECLSRQREERRRKAVAHSG